jgi:adenosylcobinamide-phosphate synthase
MTAVLAIIALAIDWIVGEPRRWHPLVAFGAYAGRVEAWLYGSQRWRGVVAVTLAVTPFAALAAGLANIGGIPGATISVAALYFALGHRSLNDHASAVEGALRAGDEADARLCASYMVSRDRETLDPAGATIESVLENGNDAVFGALFWFAVAGAGGAVAYRLVNTLDAMWGYRNTRYLAFGWAAARLDDALNWLPARATAFTYALLGRTNTAFDCWQRQAPVWDSPNAGPVMAAGAGALCVALGGPARYRGEWHARAPLGCGPAPHAGDIARALRLVTRGVLLWLAVLLAVDVIRLGIAHA